MTEFEKHPVLSIIIPVYNGDKFIKDAYEDIIKQNLESFEILLVDNNSTDNSVNLIEQYCNLDSRLKYFKEKTQGAAAARNKGIRNAKGEFIYFFDVDDQLYDNSLTVLLNCLQNDKTVDSVFGKKLVSRTRLDNRKNKKEFDIIKKEKPYWGLNWFENLNNLEGTPSFLHRKTVFDKVGVFNEELLVGEDAEFHIRLGIKCNLLFINQYIYVYFRHSESTVSKTNKKELKVFSYWPRIYKGHIPFYLKEDTTKEFKILLFRKIYGSMAKMICFTPQINQRIKLKKRLYFETERIKKPFWVDFYINLIVITKSKFFYKFFVHYVMKNKIS